MAFWRFPEARGEVDLTLYRGFQITVTVYLDGGAWRYVATVLDNRSKRVAIDGARGFTSADSALRTAIVVNTHLVDSMVVM